MVQCLAMILLKNLLTADVSPTKSVETLSTRSSSVKSRSLSRPDALYCQEISHQDYVNIPHCTSINMNIEYTLYTHIVIHI